MTIIPINKSRSIAQANTLIREKTREANIKKNISTSKIKESKTIKEYEKNYAKLNRESKERIKNPKTLLKELMKDKNYLQQIKENETLKNQYNLYNKWIKNAQRVNKKWGFIPTNYPKELIGTIYENKITPIINKWRDITTHNSKLKDIFIDPKTGLGYSMSDKIASKTNFIPAKFNIQTKEIGMNTKDLLNFENIYNKKNQIKEKTLTFIEKFKQRQENKFYEKQVSDKSIALAITELENVRKELESTNQYKKEEKIEKINEEIINLVDNLNNKLNFSPQANKVSKKITKTILESSEKIYEEGKGIIGFMANLITFNQVNKFKPKLTATEFEEDNKYKIKLNEEFGKSWGNTTTGFSQANAMKEFGDLVNLYSDEKDFHKKAYLELKSNTLYNKIMDMQKTPELKVYNQKEWKRQYREGTDAFITAGIMSQEIARLFSLGKKTLIGAKQNKILEMPKELEIKISSRTLKKLEKEVILKPEIKTFLNKKSITYKEFLKINKFSGNKFVSIGTIKGKGLTGTISTNTKGITKTIIQKRIGKVKRKIYEIIITQKKNQVLQQIKDKGTGLIVHSKRFTSKPQFGVSEPINKILTRKIKIDEKLLGSTKKEILKQERGRNIIELKKGDFSLIKGKGKQLVVKKEVSKFNPTQEGVLNQYGEIIQVIRPTKILEGRFKVLPNKKVIEKYAFNEEIARKFGLKEGLKEIGTFSKSTTGKRIITEDVQETIYLKLSKIPNTQEKIIAKLRQEINEVMKDKRGSLLPKETARTIQFPSTKIDISKLNFDKNIKFTLPQKVELATLEKLIQNKIIPLNSIKNLLKTNLKINTLEKQIHLTKAEILTKQKNLQIQKIRQKQETDLKLKQKFKMQQRKFQTIRSKFDLEKTKLTTKVPKVPTPKELIIPTFKLPPIVGMPFEVEEKENKKKIKKKKRKYKLERFSDPTLRITGKRKYSMDMIKILKDRYGNVYT
jgi:molecular chaperone GrpE (heat shock protein)